MKLKDFFDICSAKELDMVLGDLKETLPEEADEERIRQMVMDKIGSRETASMKKRAARRWWKAAAAAAACLCLVIGAGAVVAEAHEYREAVDYFQEMELSTEGLTRTEIKEVYRDIISGTFTYDKTAEVVRNGVPTEVKGLEIAQEMPEPERPKGVYWWEISDSCYSIIYDDKEGEERGSYFEKTDKGSVIWSIPFEKITLEGWTAVSDGVLVWGRTYTDPLTEPVTACLACIQDDGTLLWKNQLSHGYDSETILKVLDNGDGTYAVFTGGLLLNMENGWRVMMCQYSGGGEELAAKVILEVESKWFANAIRLGDDYLVQLCDLSNNEPCLVRLDRDGNFSDGFVYAAEDYDYYITDMALFSERLCLSAYAVPKIAEENRNLSGRADVAAVLDYLYFAGKDWWGDDFSRMPVNEEGVYEGEDLLEHLRDNFTAVLLVCDPQKGSPENFVSVQGCLGGRLAVQGEELQWEVESFSNAFFSPFTDAFSIHADCRVFRYTFDSSGELLSQEKTKKVTVFTR